MTSLLAERLISTVAPARAWAELGGIGTHRSSQISTPMTSPSELLALPGFGLDRYLKLAPFVAALPMKTTTPINICTASSYVLESLGKNLSGEYSNNPDLLTSGRKTGCFPDQKTFVSILGTDAATAAPYIGTNSSFFRLTTRVTLGTTQFTLYSLLYRGNGGKVTPLLRTFGTL